MPSPGSRAAARRHAGQQLRSLCEELGLEDVAGEFDHDTHDARSA
jgi:hypothetical protein